MRTFRQQGGLNDFIFRFHLDRVGEGDYQMRAALGGPEDDESSEIFKELFTRIAGR